jgi:hypothetical protein
MSYTLGEAAKATGMSKAAISRAIKLGAISAEKQENGSYKIDPAELHRVYPPVTTEQANQPSMQAINTTELNALNRELQARLESVLQRLSDKDEVITDLREDRDRWRTQAEKLLLTDQRAKASPDVIVTPPPTSNVIPTSPAAPPVPAKEQGWFRKMMGGR